MGVIRRLVTGVLGVAIVGGYAVIAPPPAAYATPEVPVGTYDVVYPGLGMQASWTLTPCGPDCTTANSSRDGSFVDDWTFRLHGGRWTFSGPGQFQCRTGVTAPATFDYGFDAVTLTGDGRATFTTDGCAGALGTSQAWTFDLIKTA